MMNNYMRMVAGEALPPPIFHLLEGQVQKAEPEKGILHVNYVASPDFLNPAGTVQGGMLSAMLDDLAAGLVDSTLPEHQAVVTLSMNVTYLRPAKPGQLTGQSHFIRQGRDICHVAASLYQDNKEVACATAVCKTVPLPSNDP
jgi:uncharacterized protein (TIGR00369 family)